MRSNRHQLALLLGLLLPTAALADPTAADSPAEEGATDEAVGDPAPTESEAPVVTKPDAGDPTPASDDTPPAADPPTEDPEVETAVDIPPVAPPVLAATTVPQPTPAAAIGTTSGSSRNPPNKVLLATAGGLLVATAVTYGLASKSYANVFSADERNYDDFDNMRRQTNTLTGVTAGLAAATVGTGLSAFVVGEF